MKTIIIALMAFAPLLGHSAEKKCASRATEYSVNYVKQIYQVTDEDITVGTISGNAEVPGVGGFVALGVSISLSTGLKMTVVPMMKPYSCELVDINAFEE